MSDKLNEEKGMTYPDPKKIHDVQEIEKLESLDATFKTRAKSVIEEMKKKGWKLRVLWAKRTKVENDELVKKGTASATSKHLEGKAVDLLNRVNPYPTDPKHQYYADLKNACKNADVKWGGDFKKRWDPTHFEAKN